MSVPGGGAVSANQSVIEAQTEEYRAQQWRDAVQAEIATTQQALLYAQEGKDASGNVVMTDVRVLNPATGMREPTGKKEPAGPDPEEIERLQKSLADLSSEYNQANEAVKVWNVEKWARHEKAQGRPLTPEEQAAKKADLDNTNAQTTKLFWEGETARLEFLVAQAELQGDPQASALKNQLTQAQIKAQNASAAANQASAAASRQSAAIDAMLAPYRARESAANTAATEFGTDRGYALLPGELRQQLLNAGMTELQIKELEQSIVRTGNLMPYEIGQYRANIEQTLASAGLTRAQAQNWAEKLAAGWSALEVDQLRGNARKALAEAEKAELGDPQFALKQLQEGLKAGRLSPKAANTFAQEILSGKTLGERMAQTDANALSLTGTAASNNLFVMPGQTSFDPNGTLMKALAKVGIEISPEDMALDTKTMPEWARQMGVNLDPNAGLSPMFDDQGNLASYPGWAGALAQGQVAPPPAPKPSEVPVPVPGKTEPEAPVSEWQQGVNASPVLSAAQQYGEAVNAESVAEGVTKITYKDGTTRWFNQDGSEAQEPATPQTAAPAPEPAAQTGGGGGSPNIVINVTGSGGTGGGSSPQQAGLDTIPFMPNVPRRPPHKGIATVSGSGLPPGGPPQQPPPPSVSGSGLPVKGPPHQGVANPQANTQMDTRRMRHGGMATTPPLWARRLATGRV